MNQDPKEPIEIFQETPVEKLEELAKEVFSKERTVKDYVEKGMDHPEFSSEAFLSERILPSNEL